MPKARSEEGDRDDEIDKKIADVEIEDITDDEGDDGLPPVRREQREQVRDSKTGRFVPDDKDDGQDEGFDYRIDDEGEDFGDDESGSRRKRRNRARRRATARDQALIGQLSSKVVQMETVLAEMGRGQISLAAGEIDGQLRAELGRMDEIEAVMAAALKEGDSTTVTKALRLRDEARDRVNTLRFHKDRMDRELAAAPPPAYHQQQQQQGQQGAGPDPRAERLSEVFMDRHPWFDPEDQDDDDSQLVVMLENQLAKRGSNPNSPRHWKELEKLVRQRGLGGDSQGDDMDDSSERDERPARRARPTAGRSSGGRPAGKGGFQLDPMMREALDQEGLLDTKALNKDQLARREKLVKSWKAGMEQARREGKIR